MHQKCLSESLNMLTLRVLVIGWRIITRMMQSTCAHFEASLLCIHNRIVTIVLNTLKIHYHHYYYILSLSYASEAILLTFLMTILLRHDDVLYECHVIIGTFWLNLDDVSQCCCEYRIRISWSLAIACPVTLIWRKSMLLETF